jgi:hypothetical protein
MTSPRFVPRLASLSYRRALALITFIAFVWREIYVMLELPMQKVTDEFWYVMMAHRFFTSKAWTCVNCHHPAPTASHGPLTSTLMAPVAWLFPNAMPSLRVLIPVIGALTVIGVATLAKRVHSPRAGLIAAVLAAIYPGLWIRDGLVVSEPFAMCALAWLLVSIVSWWQRPSYWWAAAVGLCAGAIALTRAELLLWALLAIFLGWRATRQWRLLPHVIVMVALIVVSISPWIAYNNGRFSKPVYLSTNLGMTLAGANCHLTYYDGRYFGYDAWACALASENSVESIRDESEKSSVMTHQATTYISAHLSRLPFVMVGREMWFFGLYRPNAVVGISQLASQPQWATWMQAGGAWILYPIFLMVMWKRRRLTDATSRLFARITLMTLAFALFLAALFVGHWRYRLGLDVVVLVTVALWLADRSRGAEQATSL